MNETSYHLAGLKMFTSRHRLGTPSFFLPNNAPPRRISRMKFSAPGKIYLGKNRLQLMLRRRDIISWLQPSRLPKKERSSRKTTDFEERGARNVCNARFGALPPFNFIATNSHSCVNIAKSGCSARSFPQRLQMRDNRIPTLSGKKSVTGSSSCMSSGDCRPSDARKKQ
ncbi:uncharacterized protein K489DRAFT_78230 [Dissoconium aciculare CBS 342.82]|jgi:hypothetical protein|uniref:Uncharacterized protein n=1 Tax=Dissoconium aciculare CBS 342.82 TaxID=1314786 RepID=A0A6J3LVE7_9PEZI|nr:uncharacterized protein K489DRAFT_78230 [Dissoconium aciculare CBS 342.82]KAF1819264.1 hypothetical protein K489DRAFT_78230 [Dissoconium aciculare CBS 342.82]